MRHGRRWLAVAAVVGVLAVAGIVVRGLDFGRRVHRRAAAWSTPPASRSSVDAGPRRSVADAGFPRAVVQRRAATATTSPCAPASMSNDEEAEVAQALAERRRRRGHQGARRADRPQPRRRAAQQGADRARRRARARRCSTSRSVPLDVRRCGGAGDGPRRADLVGVFAWLGKPVDGVFLAALLTVIGYSVNDTVVVFDRIRELLGGRSARRPRFAGSVNTAILQTVPRTVNTGLGAVFILARWPSSAATR